MPIVIIAVLKLRRIPIVAKTAESFLPSRWKKFSLLIANSDHIRAEERRNVAALEQRSKYPENSQNKLKFYA